MGRILRCVVASLTAFACEAWAQADINLQSLFAGLTQGTEVTLVTPLANGMAEVADAAGALLQGQVPGAGGAALTHAEVAQALQLATQQLALHGIVNPTAEQIRIAMFGGTLTPAGGPTVLLPGVVPGAAAVPGSAAVGGTVGVAPAARPAVPSRWKEIQ